MSKNGLLGRIFNAPKAILSGSRNGFHKERYVYIAEISHGGNNIVVCCRLTGGKGNPNYVGDKHVVQSTNRYNRHTEESHIYLNVYAILKSDWHKLSKSAKEIRDVPNLALEALVDANGFSFVNEYTYTDIDDVELIHKMRKQLLSQCRDLYIKALQASEDAA